MTAVSLTDSTGQEVATYAYDTWGKLLNKTGTIDTPFTYRAKYGYIYDKETGLYFLKSRYFDPETARFTTKDRFEGFEERPASQNPYTYCENDPVNNVDPDGEVLETIADVACIGYDGYQMYKHPSWENAGYLAWSVAATAVPFVPGSYAGRAAKYAYKSAKSAGRAKKTVKITRKAGARKKTIVIGENMDRVRSYAQQNGHKYYKPRKNDPSARLKHHERWINNKMKKGYRIIDVGPDFEARRLGRPTSNKKNPYYNMERRVTKKYRGHKKVFTRNGKYWGGVKGLDQ
ncbi:MAG: RHS repeat-associated core domain-containing protein [Rubrobacteridae bacterium]|nr:RHS repeat-associated core domain-containing protein [Rubrobacteridae bacterium]